MNQASHPFQVSGRDEFRRIIQGPADLKAHSVVASGENVDDGRFKRDSGSLTRDRRCAAAALREPIEEDAHRDPVGQFHLLATARRR